MREDNVIDEISELKETVRGNAQLFETYMWMQSAVLLVFGLLCWTL